jgi:ATP-dependent protease ClpP protease subunit
MLLQGKRAALRSSTLMIRQPLQRLSGMQASDIDIYRRVTREKTATMVRRSSDRDFESDSPCSSRIAALCTC